MYSGIFGIWNIEVRNMWSFNYLSMYNPKKKNMLKNWKSDNQPINQSINHSNLISLPATT